MRIDFFYDDDKPHQVEVAALALKGFTAAGITCEPKRWFRPDPSHPLVACYGWRIGKELRGTGRDVLVFEQGHYGNRAASYAIGWNGLNGNAIYPSAPDLTRWRKRQTLDFQKRKSLDDSRNVALIAGQVSTDSATEGVNLRQWYRMAAETLESFGLTVRFCPHPASGETYGLDSLVSTAPFRAHLLNGNLQLVCAYSSAALTEAALFGLPVIAGSPRAMAWRMAKPRGAFWQSSPMYLRPELPARAAWLADLAWTQWTLSEVESGAFVQPLLSALNGRSRPFSLSEPGARLGEAPARLDSECCP